MIFLHHESGIATSSNPANKKLAAKIKDLELKLAAYEKGAAPQRISEEFRRLANRSRDGIYRYDLTTHRFLFINNMFLEYYGIDVEGGREVTAKSVLNSFCPEDLDKVKKARDESLAPGSTGGEAEYRQIRSDGSLHWMHDQWIIITDETGNPVTIEGIVRDITEHKRLEEEQRRDRGSAERLAEEMKVIAEIGRLISSTLDIEEVYERFAAEARKLIPFDSLIVNLKKPQKDTMDIAYASGADIPERRKGDSFPLKGSVSGFAMRTRTGLIVRADILKKTGRVSTLGINLQAGMRSMMSAPLISRDEAIGALTFRAEKQDAYNEQDLRLAEKIVAQIAGAIANAELFADLKNTEESLRESEGRFRALFEQAAAGVAEIDIKTGRFLTVNRRLCEMAGRTEEELLNTTFQAITHPEDLQLHVEKTRMMLAGKIDHYSLENRYLRKDGEAVWVEITVSLLWKRGETPGQNIAVIQDITDRKRMEEEMREMSFRDQLTELYNRRGFITLTEQQLKAANRAKRPMRLTFIDCDGLKWINDTLGHEEGDKALVDTANVLRQTFRESDIIARLSGDEFAVLSIDATDMNPEVFSKRLQQSIDEYNEKESRPYKLAMSWGTAIYNPESPMSLDKLMSSADQLMYAQKKSKSSRRV